MKIDQDGLLVLQEKFVEPVERPVIDGLAERRPASTLRYGRVARNRPQTTLRVANLAQQPP